MRARARPACAREACAAAARRGAHKARVRWLIPARNRCRGGGRKLSPRVLGGTGRGLGGDWAGTGWVLECSGGRKLSPRVLEGYWRGTRRVLECSGGRKRVDDRAEQGRRQYGACVRACVCASWRARACCVGVCSFTATPIRRTRSRASSPRPSSRGPLSCSTGYSRGAQGVPRGYSRGTLGVQYGARTAERSALGLGAD